jgi:hypothetical protein
MRPSDLFCSQAFGSGEMAEQIRASNCRWPNCLPGGTGNPGKLFDKMRAVREKQAIGIWPLASGFVLEGLTEW